MDDETTGPLDYLEIPEKNSMNRVNINRYKSKFRIVRYSQSI